MAAGRSRLGGMLRSELGGRGLACLIIQALQVALELLGHVRDRLRIAFRGGADGDLLSGHVRCSWHKANIAHLHGASQPLH